jgi:hypothetical protein
MGRSLRDRARLVAQCKNTRAPVGMEPDFVDGLRDSVGEHARVLLRPRRYNQPRHEGHVIRIDVGTYTVDATPSVHPSWGKGSADVEGPSLLWSHDVVDEHHQHLARLAGGLILRMDGPVQGGDEDERFTVTAADDFPGMVQQSADEIAHHLDDFHRGRKSWRGWFRSLAPWLP